MFRRLHKKFFIRPILSAAGLLLSVLNLYGASSADVSLSIRPIMLTTPANVIDLTVTPTVQEGQLQLNWTAPTVFPGTSLDSYQIHVQTFSLADVGGSTTTWWGASGGILVQGLYGESPGQAVVRTLGPPGSSHLASLFPGATYYVAVRSADDLGTPRDLWSVPVQVVFGVPLDTAPGTPSGLAAIGAVNSISLSWTDLSSTQKGLDFDRYQIYRSTQSGTGFVLLASTTTAAYSDNSVVSGTVYYYRLTALDLGAPAYPGVALESAPSVEVSATSGSPPTQGTPLQPTGLTGALGGGQFVLSWKPVTQDTAGQPVDISQYKVYRYDALGSTPTATFTIAASSAPSYTDTVGGLTFYYRVFAVSTFGKTSAASDYIDCSIQAIHYTIASDDIDTRVVIPDSLAQELLASHNSYGTDLEMRLERRQQDEANVTLKSYRVVVYKVLGQQEVPFFAFSQMGMQVQLGLGSILGVGRLDPTQAQKLSQISATDAGSIAQIVSVYWYNGANYIRISDPLLTSNQAIAVSVKNVGVYQVRASQISTVFKLTQGSPYPRIITPNGAENHRVFWFFDNPSGDPVTGTIYDIRGAKVRDLEMNSQSPTANSIVWDGRDGNGAVVPSGVYLYKIQAGKEKTTGTVVVAR